MRVHIASFAAGLLFGAGLAVSRMIDPAKVLAFLDFGAITTGGWDPSLALVMLGALAVAAVGFRFAGARARPVWSPAFHLPARRQVDAPLIAGAAVFGIGWGLVGYCSGPAIASLTYGLGATAMFVVAMLVGMVVHHVVREPDGVIMAAGSSRGRSASTGNSHRGPGY
jgi:uncharacterized protein